MNTIHETPKTLPDLYLTPPEWGDGDAKLLTSQEYDKMREELLTMWNVEDLTEATEEDLHNGTVEGEESWSDSTKSDLEFTFTGSATSTGKAIYEATGTAAMQFHKKLVLVEEQYVVKPTLDELDELEAFQLKREAPERRAAATKRWHRCHDDAAKSAEKAAQALQKANEAEEAAKLAREAAESWAIKASEMQKAAEEAEQDVRDENVYLAALESGDTRQEVLAALPPADRNWAALQLDKAAELLRLEEIPSTPETIERLIDVRCKLGLPNRKAK